MKPYKAHNTIIREIMSKKPGVEVEKPFDNEEAEQVETPAERVKRRYCTTGAKLDQVKKKIIDNA